MLEGLFSKLSKPVPPQKTKSNAKNTETTAHQIDDRHHCRECLYLSSAGYCIQQRFRPADDIPRRCDDFKGTPPVIEQRASRTTASDPLRVTLWTPAGTPIQTRARDAEHAAFMLRMNPRLETPAPKPEPMPAGRTLSEAEHNAQGRFFKFLITRQDGTQFYSCSMPRQIIDEVRIQYPDAANIEPITGEEHIDDG